MIDFETIRDAAVELCKKSMFDVPDDIVTAYRDTYEKETGLARELWGDLIRKVESRVMGVDRFCGDSGFITYYLTVGAGSRLKRGTNIRKALVEATRKATLEPPAPLRASICDPITRENFPDNITINCPYVYYKYNTTLDFLELTVVCKGGGSEIFGSEFKHLLSADGLPGLKKFVLDAVWRSCRYGKTCPPNIFGIGVGGTIDIACKLATEAATLRPYGSRHPLKRLEEFEEELMEDINNLGIGPMGLGGNVTAMDVHLELAGVHSAGLPVAVVPQCVGVQRATAKIDNDGAIEYKWHPENWFER